MIFCVCCLPFKLTSEGVPGLLTPQSLWRRGLTAVGHYPAPGPAAGPRTPPGPEGSLRSMWPRRVRASVAGVGRARAQHAAAVWKQRDDWRDRERLDWDWDWDTPQTVQPVWTPSQLRWDWTLPGCDDHRPNTFTQQYFSTHWLETHTLHSTWNSRRQIPVKENNGASEGGRKNFDPLFRLVKENQSIICWTFSVTN